MTEHDPIARQLPQEPRFPLMGRDPTAADLVRLWFAMRKRDRSLCDAIYSRLMRTMGELPYQPRKDSEHIQSATKIANEMDLFLTQERARLHEAERPETSA